MQYALHYASLQHERVACCAC